MSENVFTERARDMATINDVAKLAGVSVATVSRVINDSGKVQPHTADAVKQAIEALAYRPNVMGRNLRKAKANRILVIQPSISNLFFSKIVRGIEQAARPAGYQIMLCDTDYDPEREAMYLDWLDSCVADGAILITSCHEPRHYATIAQRRPIVHCSEDYADAALPCVTMDNVVASRDAVSHLIKLNHRKIAFFSVHNKLHTVKQRYQGYRAALADAGIEPIPEYCVKHGSVPDDMIWEKTCEYAAQFAQMNDPPTAIFCTSDMIAIATIRALIANGVRVPDEMSVMGFDDIEIARIFSPSLTTVSIPKHFIGRSAVELLIERLGNPALAARKVLVDHTIVDRESCKYR